MLQIYGVGPSLNCPIPPFKRVMILMVGFRVQTTAMAHSEDIFWFVRNFYLCIVTDKLTHSSTKSDVIFEGADKLLRRLHGVDIRDQGIFANKDLSHHDTRVDGWGIREYGICGYSFICSGIMETYI